MTLKRVCGYGRARRAIQSIARVLNNLAVRFGKRVRRFNRQALWRAEQFQKRRADAGASARAPRTRRCNAPSLTTISPRVPGSRRGNRSGVGGCLVRYFFISGFPNRYPALENVAKIRILVGLQTDRAAYDLIQDAQLALPFQSHAATQEQIARDAWRELEAVPDEARIEIGVCKFVDWLRAGKLEIKDAARARRSPAKMARKQASWNI
jgi:hypothetical protein